MMSNNKILTVSYGTFSCTLEGFDDSFGTMKAIAEYFRDLASDDRYFGAEPPQPDAEMLTRIAQKEISRRVEAREHDGKIVLSATDEASTDASDALPVAATAATALLSGDTQEAPGKAATTPPAPSADHSDAPVQQAPAASDVEAPAAKAIVEVEEDAELAEDAPTDAPAAQNVEDEIDIVPGQPDSEVEAFFANSPSAQTDGDAEFEETGTASAADAPRAAPNAKSESIAAKLQRIRAVVAQNDVRDEDDDYSEDEHAEGEIAPLNLSSEARTDDAFVDEDEDEDDFESERAIDIDLEEDADDADLDLTAALAEYEDQEDDLSFDDEADADEEEFEAYNDESAEDPLADAAFEDADEDSNAQSEIGIAALLSRLERSEAAEAKVIEEEAEDELSSDSGADADDHEEEDLVGSLLDSEKDSSSEAAVKAALSANGTDATSDEAADAALEAGEDVPAEPKVTIIEESSRLNRRARVIKVKRAALAAAIEHGRLEEYGQEDDGRVGLDDLAPAKFGTTSLSPEDEAELARELADLEADIESDQDTDEQAHDQAEDHDGLLNGPITLSEDMRTDVMAVDEADDEDDEIDIDADIDVDIDDDENLFADDEDTSDDDEDEDEDDVATSARNALPTLDSEQDGDMSRLMAEADQQMGEPESATRRDAFAHLRAAVAAKKADEALGQSGDADNSDDAYRNDLADVVHPRRPNRRTARTQRPAKSRPAPLKLVAEQRIDTEDGVVAKGPVRPRRVASAAQPVQGEGDNFAEFADEMGATSLPQLLEAAAAYMAFVEGREQFSRPQLMTKVRQVGPEEGFSREDGLRHFGQLLRAGKIEKIKGGRFTVSEDIGFRPDQREAS